MQTQSLAPMAIRSWAIVAVLWRPDPDRAFVNKQEDVRDALADVMEGQVVLNGRQRRLSREGASKSVLFTHWSPEATFYESRFRRSLDVGSLSACTAVGSTTSCSCRGSP